MAIINTQLTTSGNPPVQVYKSVGQNALTTVFLCNTSTVATASLDIYVVSDASGLSAGPATQIMSAIPLPPSETFVMDTEKLILENNDLLLVRTDTPNAVTVTVSSVSTA